MLRVKHASSSFIPFPGEPANAPLVVMRDGCKQGAVGGIRLFQVTVGKTRSSEVLVDVIECITCKLCG